MLFGRDQWPGGQNLMTTPVIWHKVFDILPSPNLGINYDPSHFVWQMIDYIKPIYEFKDKIFHVHYKDIKLFQDKLERVGVMAIRWTSCRPSSPVSAMWIGGASSPRSRISAMTASPASRWRIRPLRAVRRLCWIPCASANAILSSSLSELNFALRSYARTANPAHSCLP